MEKNTNYKKHSRMMLQGLESVLKNDFSRILLSSFDYAFQIPFDNFYSIKTSL